MLRMMGPALELLAWIACRHVQVRHCLGNPESQQSRQGSATREIGRAEQSVAACLWPLVLECRPALADVEAKYNPTQGSESVKTVAGVFYAGLLAIFAFRLLSRRAKKFRDEVSCILLPVCLSPLMSKCSQPHHEACISV